MERPREVNVNNDMTRVPAPRRRERSHLILSTALIGIGIMAAVDEIVFHQLLNWHHFYVGSTLGVALLSDGLLHAAELIAIIGGFFMFADLHDRGIRSPALAWGGLFLGAGIFQLFDGLVDHKVLRVHQIRYGVDNLLAYDLAWNASGILLVLVGIVIIQRLGGGTSPASDEGTAG